MPGDAAPPAPPLPPTPPAPRARPEPAPSFVWTRERMDAYFRAGAFVLLLLLGAIAAFRAYFALESSILTWLRPQYVPLAQAGFSLAMLAIVVYLLRTWVIARAR